MHDQVYCAKVHMHCSDHLPLFLDLRKILYVPKGKRFRFENIWIREKDYFNLINNCWADMGSSDLMKNWRTVV